MDSFVADQCDDGKQFDVDFSQKPLGSEEREYYCNIRRFKGGAIEAVMRPVRQMQREACKERWESFGTNAGVKVKKPDEDREYERQANHNRAVRRAKQTIRFLIKENQMDRMLTLVYRENMTDREQVKEHFTRFIRLVREHVPGWSYVAVLERQERGAYHIHCAVRGWQRIKVLRACWHEALGVKGSVKAMLSDGVVLASGELSPGNVDVTRPDNGGRREWQVGRLAGYLTKYLAKTFDQTAAEKKRYWQSKDCSQPVSVRRWVAGAGPFEAFSNCLAQLRQDFGLLRGADYWSSEDMTTFWIGGRFNPDPLLNCPF